MGIQLASISIGAMAEHRVGGLRGGMCSRHAVWCWVAAKPRLVVWGTWRWKVVFQILVLRFCELQLVSNSGLLDTDARREIGSRLEY